jgi:hypothetical protein
MNEKILKYYKKKENSIIYNIEKLVSRAVPDEYFDDIKMYTIVLLDYYVHEHDLGFLDFYTYDKIILLLICTCFFIVLKFHYDQYNFNVTIFRNSGVRTSDILALEKIILEDVEFELCRILNVLN